MKVGGRTMCYEGPVKKPEGREGQRQKAFETRPSFNLTVSLLQAFETRPSSNLTVSLLPALSFTRWPWAKWALGPKTLAFLTRNIKATGAPSF